jgi:hypothetical protein
MYIKSQTFNDEDTLLEMLFDFSLGESSPLIQQLIADIDKGLQENEAYIKYYASLETEDDKEELYTEERDLRLAEQLMDMFDSFVVEGGKDTAKMYGVNKTERMLLYGMDLI